MDLEHLSLLFEVLNAYNKHCVMAAASAASRAHSDASIEDLRMALTNVPVDYPRVEAAWAAVAQQLEGTQWDIAERDALHKRFADMLDPTTKNAGGPPKPFWSSSVPAYRTKSCYVQQEMHCVLPGKLYVGSYHPAADRTVLDQQGITHICCCINVSPRFPAFYGYLTLPADDAVGYDISQFFATSFDFIDNALCSNNGGNNGKVLVHCGAGISRAPTIAAAYLMRKLGLSANDAVKHIKSIRTCASPNRGFVQQLQKFEQELRRSIPRVAAASSE